MLKLKKKRLKLERLIILVDQEKHYGIRAKQVGLLKRLLKLKLMMIKTPFG